MDLVNRLFELEQKRSGNKNRVKINGNSAIILYNSDKYYYTPDIIIKNIEELNKALNRYLMAVKQSNMQFADYDGKHGDYEDYFLMYLYRNMSNTDYQDFTTYVKRYTSFILDQTFSEYDERQKVGEYGEHSIFIQRLQSMRGTETPHIMKFYLEPSVQKENNDLYSFPFIRYGISDIYDKKSIEIFTVQNGPHIQEGEYVEQAKGLIRQVNTGIKGQEYRTLNPYMLTSLAMFFKLIHNDGIRDIIVPDTMNYRYGVFKGVETDEERNRIQGNITDKFMTLFLRLEHQVTGVNITSFPNDVDSFMHIQLSDKLTPINPTLQSFCDIKNIPYKYIKNDSIER